MFSKFSQYIHQLMYIIVTHWLNHINKYCLNKHFDFIKIIMEILRVRSMYQYAHAVCVCKQSVEGEDQQFRSYQLKNLQRKKELKWAVPVEKVNLYSTFCEVSSQRGLTSRSYCLFTIYVLGRGVGSSMFMSVMMLAIFE